MKNIIIVNGYPTCGKTTFNNIISQRCKTKIFSSIEPINNILSYMGWDGKTKDNKYRNFASIMKRESTIFNDYCFNKVCQQIDYFLKHDENELLLIDIREPEEIDKVKNKYGDKVITVFIQNDNNKIHITNDSDLNVEDYIYDYYIDNNDTIDELKYNIQVFLNNLILESAIKKNSEKWLI